MIRIVTDYPDAIESPDFYMPIGSIQDNHSNPIYLSELKRIAGSEKFSYLDLACAGGQSVVDLYLNGNIACGVEGSDLNKILNSKKWGPTHFGSDIVKSGSENWKKYKDSCLFKADIAKPFELVNENKKTQTFDIITAWDFLEHPSPEQIPTVIENVKKHLSKQGVFVCSISTLSGHHHQCIKPKAWWIEKFSEKGLVDIGFCFNASPRHINSPIADNEDMGFMFKHK